MLRETFIGRRPSHFQVNSIVKAFIVSEMCIWSAQNFVIPIFAIFASTQITGGNIEIAASSFSIFLIVRVFFELFSGRFLVKVGELRKFLVAILGITILALSYIGFAHTMTVFSLFFFYGLAGLGLGIAGPAKNSLFSTHLDKNKEASEWSLYDAAVFIGMALASALGGFIAKDYGFKVLFYLSAIVTFMGVIPYILYIHQDKTYIERLRERMGFKKNVQ